MVTSAADLGDLQTKPNQILQIYPYMIYLFENSRPRTLQCTVGKIRGVDLGSPKNSVFLGEKLLKRGLKAIKTIYIMIFF